MTKEELLQKLRRPSLKMVTTYYSVSDCLDEMVHDAKSSEASDINNEGYGAQVEYLLKFGHSVQAIAEATGLAPVDP